MRARKSLLAVLLAFATLLATFVSPVQRAAAADIAEIKVSGGSCTVGGKVTVKVTVTAPAEFFIIDFTLTYDAAGLTYTGGDANGAIRMLDTDASGKSKTYSFEFVGNKAGSYAVSVMKSKDSVLRKEKVNNNDYYDDVVVTNGTVTVNPPYQASTNAYLSKLSVGQGSLSPAFSKDTMNYTVNVDGSVSSLTVSATAADSKAKVAVNGNKNLKEGSNTVTVVVTAEDGKTKKTYTITVNRGPAPTPTPTPTPTPGLVVKVGDADLTLRDTFEGDLPEGFAGDTVDMDGYKVAMATNEDKSITLVQMDDNNFYVKGENGTYYRYRPLNASVRQYTAVPVPEDEEIPEGFTETTAEVFGTSMKAWKTEADKEIALLYLRSPEGEEGWYLFDSKEGTVQRYRKNLYNAEPSPTPTPSPEPSPTTTPTPEPGENNPSQPEKTKTNQGRGLWAMIESLTHRERIGAGIIGGLFLLFILFLVLFIMERRRRNRQWAAVEARAEEEEMNKTFDPRMLLTEEEEAAEEAKSKKGVSDFDLSDYNDED